MRPALFHINTNVIWTITTYDPDKPGVEKDADSNPTVTIRKNGTSVGDSVTVTKRASSTGIYDCSYNPAGEVESDTFTIEESVTITGSTTPSATYRYRWAIEAVALERGTDSVTSFPASAPANWLGAAGIAAGALNGKGDWSVVGSAMTLAANAITAAAIQANALNGKGDWATPGAEMSLTSTILTALFADADVTDLVNQITAKFDDIADLPIITIANACRDAILNRVLSGNHDTAGTAGKIIQDILARIGVPTTTLAGDIATRLATAGYTAPDNATIAAISGRLPAALVDGRMDSMVGAMGTNVITAASIQAGALNGKGDWALIGSAMTLAANAITAATIQAGALNSKGDWAVPGSAMALVANAITSASVQAAALNGKGNWSVAGDQMSLTSTILTQLFADADVADLVNQIVAKFDEVGDLPIATIAATTRDAILNRLLAGNHDTAGTMGKIIQDILTQATGAKTSSDSADAKLTNGRLTKIDGAAQTGADGDTLKTLSDQIDVISGGGEGGGEVNSFTPNASTQLAAIIAQNRPRIQMQYTLDIMLTAFDRFAQDFVSLGSLTSRSNLVFMIKESLSDADADALLWVDEDTGLIRVNGAAAGSSALGSLTVNDATAGNISVVVDASVTGVIAPTSANGYFYAIKLMKTGGVGSRQLRTGRVVVVNGVVRANE